MKTLLCLVALLFCMARTEAQSFYPLYLNGSLKWNVTNPQCEFRLNGKLTNVSPSGTGTIRLILWATKDPYPNVIPSPSTGYNVGEYLLGQLGPGYQFTDFTVKTKADLPFINGEFYFTIAVLEYTTAGWRNLGFVPTGTRSLTNGNFTDQKKWKIPAKPVIKPPLPILPGDIINLREKATGQFNQFPFNWQSKTKLTVNDELTKINYQSMNRKATVSYTDTVVKKKLRHKKLWARKIVMTYSVKNNITFKNTVYLFYQGNKVGSYRSEVKGYLFDGEFGNSTTYGTFKIKQ